MLRFRPPDVRQDKTLQDAINAVGSLPFPAPGPIEELSDAHSNLVEWDGHIAGIALSGGGSELGTRGREIPESWLDEQTDLGASLQRLSQTQDPSVASAATKLLEYYEAVENLRQTIARYCVSD